MKGAKLKRKVLLLEMCDVQKLYEVKEDPV